MLKSSHVSTTTGDLAAVGGLRGNRSTQPTVSAVLKEILLHPFDRFVRLWNWKSAVLSSILRALIFFVVNLRAGWKAALGAMLAELAFRAVVSGLCGGLTEAFRDASPRWAATLSVKVLQPFANHTFEFLLHWLRHTPALKASIITSVAFTAVSSAFNLHAMREGALVIGNNSQSLILDLKRLPRLLVSFFAFPVKKLKSWCLGPRSSRSPGYVSGDGGG